MYHYNYILTSAVVGQKLFGFLIPFEKVCVLLQYHVCICALITNSVSRARQVQREK